VQAPVPGEDMPAGSRTMAVGRPLQARLIALETRVGLFTEEESFASDSRFNHPVIVATPHPLPPGMAQVFAVELAELARLGRPADVCHAEALGPYRVCCTAYFHYDGLKALVYVEREGRFIAAWKDEEVLQPDSPRHFVAGALDDEIEDFLRQGEQLGEPR
jgi:hypothetical protein